MKIYRIERTIDGKTTALTPATIKVTPTIIDEDIDKVIFQDVYRIWIDALDKCLKDGRMTIGHVIGELPDAVSYSVYAITDGERDDSYRRTVTYSMQNWVKEKDLAILPEYLKNSLMSQ